jgi:hypothetical protein
VEQEATVDQESFTSLPEDNVEQVDTYFMLDSNGVICNCILASESFLKQLPLNWFIFKKEPEYKMDIGWYIDNNGEWTPPQEVE